MFLQRLWKTIEARAKSATAPSLVYQEAELPLRIVRDLFAGDFVAAHVDSDRTYKRIVELPQEDLAAHGGARPSHEGQGAAVRALRRGERDRLDPRSARRPPSGGYLIFDYAEAFTVIDVNTGRFVGSRSKSSTQRLEDTATKNNLEAVKEVVRQLRLRDIGGIIVIDFIDMANPKNRQAVEEALRTELERDRTKTYVVEISPLGLVEMTRQNVTDGPREIMTRPCPTCGGDGIVVSDATNALQIERRLRALAVAGAGLARPGVQGRSPPTHARARRRPGRRAARRARGVDATPVLPRAGRGPRPCRPLRGRRRGQARRPGARGAARGGGRARASSSSRSTSTTVRTRSGRSTASTSSSRDAAKLVGKKRKVVIGRVLEGRAYAIPRRHRRRRSADHLRERGREAHARADAPQGCGAPLDADAPADEAEARRRRAGARRHGSGGRRCDAADEADVEAAA